MLNLGRKPRAYNPSVPHMSALMGGRTLPPAPIAVDYTDKMPDDFGVMLNDHLGDCTCAAYYHARQVWSFNSGGKEITEPDHAVLELYKKSCGYDPSNPTTDEGGVEQDVLTYLLNVGAPDCQPIKAFVEIDPRNLDDMKRAIYDTGCVYIGINLPQHIMDGDSPPIQWGVVPGDTIAGGHAIILVGYTMDGFYLISWGKKYFCTNSFLAAYCEEAYVIADSQWINAGGSTPLGMSLSDLEGLMEALKNA